MTVPTRRMKTCTGTQGYVYQYYFVGQRRALPDFAEGPANEYVFDVTSDRKTTFAVSVFLPDETLNNWAAAHGRSLIAPEQYGAAKMRLLKAFDEIENMMNDGRRLVIDHQSLQEVLAMLQVE